MTPQELNQQVLSEELKNAKYQNLNDWQVAQLLHTPDPELPLVTKLVSIMVGPGLVMETIGAEEGAALLDSLTQLSAISSPVKWAMKMIEKEGVDVASDTFREQLDMLVNLGKISAENARKIKSLAEVSRYQSWAEYKQIEVTARSVGLARGGR